MVLIGAVGVLHQAESTKNTTGMSRFSARAQRCSVKQKQLIFWK